LLLYLLLFVHFSLYWCFGFDYRQRCCCAATSSQWACVCVCVWQRL